MPTAPWGSVETTLASGAALVALVAAAVLAANPHDTQRRGCFDQ